MPADDPNPNANPCARAWRRRAQDNIAPEVIEALQPLLQNPDFQPDKIKKVSQAAYGLCSWVRAMDTYNRVAKVSDARALPGSRLLVAV